MRDSEINVGNLIDRLKLLDRNIPVQFYFLKNYNLNNCKLETIIDADGQAEITIQESGEK
jgi:hypothetical protein